MGVELTVIHRHALIGTDPDMTVSIDGRGIAIGLQAEKALSVSEVPETPVAPEVGATVGTDPYVTICIFSDEVDESGHLRPGARHRLEPIVSTQE